MSNTGQYDSVMHVIADKLLEHFDFTGAINYLEQTFESKDDPSKSFVLTMQMREGLTPCEKLFAAEQRIADQLKLIEVAGKRIDELELALLYYADEGHFKHGDVPGHIYALDDAGHIARNALGIDQKEVDRRVLATYYKD